MIPATQTLGSQVPPTAGEARRFAAETLRRRASPWPAGKAVLLDRQPHGPVTEFRHRLTRHTIVMHIEGANTYAALSYDGGSRVLTDSTIGRVTLIPAGHELEGCSDFPARIRHLMLLLDPGALAALAEEGPSARLADPPYRQHLADGIIASQMRALGVELDEPGLMGRLYAESLCCAIAIRALRLNHAAAAAPARGGLASRRLRLVQDYIEANLARDITLADLAAVAGVGRTHFCRAFHKSTGIASHRYIIARRVERARKLLVETRSPIAEIALAVGFGDQSHMTAHFRRVVGTTPRRFREDAAPAVVAAIVTELRPPITATTAQTPQGRPSRAGREFRSWPGRGQGPGAGASAVALAPAGRRHRSISWE
jgi:AraC family transcriptional regulator